MRPLHQISASIDGVQLAGELKLGAGMVRPYATHKAHPFHAEKPVSLSHFDSYLEDMKAGYVWVDQTARKAEIRQRAL